MNIGRIILRNQLEDLMDLMDLVDPVNLGFTCPIAGSKNAWGGTGPVLA
jgi:hypothetical protein